MALEKYRQKRDFRITPEPAGKVGKGRRRDLSFVIQKHAATRLHYDFRLELNGVLLSWAVPKGPSLDPNDKRLAMHVEDHPMEYGDFEGVIPAKQYGAGTVMVWDRGTWLPKSDPVEGYAKGRLKFDLDGEKLKGGWNLVKSHSGKYGGDSWLLIKEADAYARLGGDAQIVEDQPDSVLSGRDMKEIAAAADRVWHSNRSAAENVKAGATARSNPKSNALAGLAKLKGGKKAPLPRKVGAQLATLATSPPTGDAWVHEIKYDGYRMLCRIESGEVRMRSRNDKDWTGNFPSLVKALSRLPVQSAWLDGEVVAVDADGRSRFQALQNALSGATTPPLTFMAFDVLYLDGYDVRGVALVERKRVLERLLEDAPPNIQYSEHFAVPGRPFFDNVCKLGLEGMVSKRGDLPYTAGRAPTWQKIKCERRQEMVIGGYTDPEGSRTGFGALLLGVYEPDGTLSYSGRVGTGFNQASLTTLTRTLKGLETKASPFRNPPRGYEAKGVHWVTPTLVAEVSFSEWTDDATLRHPSFRGLRADKPAQDVVREEPITKDEDPPATPPRAATVTAQSAPRADPHAVAGISISNPTKALYPEAKITKRDVALYYAAVGEWMLPHLKDRPLTLVRCPDGWNKECFYQKKAESGVSEAIARVKIQGSDGKTSLYMMANSVAAIVSLSQMGVLEIHPWGSSEPKLRFPDRLIFDLDPDEAVSWNELKQAALLVKTLIENIGLTPFLKTTGGKGVHVVVPIEPTVGWEEAKGFTKAVAELLEQTFRDRFTSKLLKVSRGGKIFIDYLRNSEGATAVGAYSTRAKENAPVSTPIEWEELSRDVRYAHFNINNVPKRLAKLKQDPWEALEASAGSLTRAVMAKVGFKPS